MGNFWLTTEFNGIIHLAFNSDDLSDYKITHFDTTSGLPQMNYNYVHLFDGKLVVGTANGIYKAVLPQNQDISSVSFIPDTSFGRQFTDNHIGISQILYDDNSTFWMNSGEQAGPVLKDENGHYIWDTRPLKRLPSIYKIFTSDSGLVWICGKDGLFRYDTKMQKDYNVPFYSLIREVTIGQDSTIFFGTGYNESSRKDGYYKQFTCDQPKHTIPTIPYEDNTLKFQYSAITFEEPAKTYFSIFLKGFDKDWSAWNKENKKEYTNLPEGDYIFQVKAKNLYDTESEIASFRFHIEPPWSRTMAAYIIYGILGIFLIWIIVKITTLKLKRDKRKLEMTVRKRTTEISLQKEELQTQAEHLSLMNMELEKLSIVASETDNSVLIADGHGEILWANDAFTRLFGYSLDEYRSEKGSNLIAASTNSDFDELFQKCISAKISVVYVTLTKNKQQEEIWVQTNLLPIL
ncbi:MAG: triple tyrosine motif-containing protein, partial [Bacteroidota bacterium]